jgi:hypothetical protein
MKRKEEGLKKNILRTLEMSYIFKNLRSRLELRKERKLKREKESDKNYWLPKNIKRD